MNNNTNTTETAEFNFNLSETGSQLIESHDMTVSTGQMTANQSALNAITDAFSLQYELLQQFTTEKESLSAVIERVIDDIKGADLEAKRSVVRDHLVALDKWDKKYISETLCRVFRGLGLEPKRKAGRKAEADVVAMVEKFVEENPEISISDVVKKFRAASTYASKLAKEEA